MAKNQGRRYRMGPNGEEPVWASKQKTIDAGRAEGGQAARENREPIHYGNLTYDSASAQEFYRLTGKWPSWRQAGGAS